MPPSLADIKRRRELERLAASAKPDLNKETLQAQFLHFSSLQEGATLKVHFPRSYAVQGDEQQHLAEALSYLGMCADPVPKQIDFSGGTDYTGKQDALILVSAGQFDAEHYSSLRACLDPLLEKVWTDGNSLIKEFGIHEAICGKVTASRGTLNLTEVALFPEKFAPGPYTLSVELDTPKHTVKNFRELSSMLGDLTEDAKGYLLDNQKLSQAVSRALELRERLGSLSRYYSPTRQTFEAKTSTYVARTATGSQFYLYTPTMRNVLVYFGKNPFNGNDAPLGLLVLNGEEHEKTLATLVKEGVYSPGTDVLADRCMGLTKLYEDGVRAEHKTMNGDYPDFQKLRDRLYEIYNGIKDITDEGARRQYATAQPPELLEFLVYPSMKDSAGKASDPVLHELLPMLSWNSSVRLYNDTQRFIREFMSAPEEGRTGLLKEVVSNIMLSNPRDTETVSNIINHQNNDVNCWLYAQYREFCTNAGISFQVA